MRIAMFAPLCLAAMTSALLAAPPRPRGGGLTRRRPELTRGRGMFDFLADAFKNEAFDDRRARASHILVATKAEAEDAKAAVAGGQTFSDAASQYSTCPSAKSGGSLGSFEPGKMVKEFDDVCFDDSVPVGEVVGPVKTQFGYHLILVEERFVNQERSEGSSVF